MCMLYGSIWKKIKQTEDIKKSHKKDNLKKVKIQLNEKCLPIYKWWQIDIL